MTHLPKYAAALIATTVICLQNASGDAVDDLIKTATSNASTKDRIRAIKALGGSQEKSALGKVASACERLMQDKDAEIRAEAVIASAMHAFRNKQKCPIAVVKALFDPDESVRGNAYSHFNIPHEGFTPEALPLLLRALEHEDTGVRSNVPDALARFSDNKKEIVAALEKVAKDKDRLVRNNAEVALWKINQDWDRYVRLMLVNIEASESPNAADFKGNTADEERDRTQRNLLAIGSASRMNDLGKDEPEKLAASLIKHFSDKKPGIRRCAARSLGAIAMNNAKTKEVVRGLKAQLELKKLLDDADETVRVAAETAIKRITD